MRRLDVERIGKRAGGKGAIISLFAQKIEEEIKKIDEKLEKLMNAYLENVLSLEKYREAKNKLVNQKQFLKDKLAAFEQKSNNRFELAPPIHK